MNLLAVLHRNRFINSLVKWSRINKFVDFCLSNHPLIRRTRTGLVYKVGDVPSMVVANEVFGPGAYAKAVKLIAPSTFVDLGANVGYFPVLVADVVNSRQIRGLCVEPNPSLRESAIFHITTNMLENVHFKEAAVGSDTSGAEIDFFINPSHIASSVFQKFNPLIPVGGKVQRIKVPALNVLEEWDRLFPKSRIDLLKIDIEGAEVDFLQSHSSFIERVDSVIIEWHAWVTSLHEVSRLMERYGMVLEEVYDEDQHAGTVLFRRKN